MGYNKVDPLHDLVSCDPPQQLIICTVIGGGKHFAHAAGTLEHVCGTLSVFGTHIPVRIAEICPLRPSGSAPDFLRGLIAGVVMSAAIKQRQFVVGTRVIAETQQPQRFAFAVNRCTGAGGKVQRPGIRAVEGVFEIMIFAPLIIVGKPLIIQISGGFPIIACRLFIAVGKHLRQQWNYIVIMLLLKSFGKII